MDQITQNTPEWFDLKRGKIGASHMADVLMKPTLAGYRNYQMKVALERMTGRTEATYSSYDMQQGIALEPVARECYMFETGYEVTQIAWVDHPTVPNAGASPDGLIEAENGLVEYKCVLPATHANFRLTEEIDRKYLLQMQWQMACKPNSLWNDFCSYCPAFPEHMQLKIIRVWRDDHKIDELQDAVVKFNRAVDQMVSDLEAS